VYPTQTTAREQYDADLAKLILRELPIRPDLIVCAGWMHILGPMFLSPMKAAGIPIINLHPALPGAFNGAHAIERAWKAFQDGEIEKTGVMIHYVIEEVDEGQPIVVREITMIRGESLEELETRIHQVEHQAIVQGTNIALTQLKK
jgi:phosphoribosylglycinamide formyltransferase